MAVKSVRVISTACHLHTALLIICNFKAVSTKVVPLRKSVMTMPIGIMGNDDSLVLF